MNATEFRKELKKIMPGYNWTIHKSSNPDLYLSATGIVSAGFNRISTLQITRREGEYNKYEAKSSGFGLRAPWLGIRTAPTLARALRELQDHYEYEANNYSTHARALKGARAKKGEGDADSD